jgi:hypothetical protein
MKKILFFSLLWIIHAPVKAQFCESPDLDSSEIVSLPWYGNATFLPSFGDSVLSSFSSPESMSSLYEGGFHNDAIYKIPIQFYLYSSNNQLNAIQSDIGKIVAELNKRFKGLFLDFNNNIQDTRIVFYNYATPQLTLNSDLAWQFGRQQGIVTHYQSNYTIATLNIHLLQTRSPNQNWEGDAEPPGQGNRNYSLAVNSDAAFEVFISNLAHQIGHALGLAHTDRGRNGQGNLSNSAKNGLATDKCFQEAVARNQHMLSNCYDWWAVPNPLPLACAFNGDLLCDTEADPGMISNDVILNPITNTYYYDGGGSDLWGNGVESQWRPDVFNFMASGRREIRCRFSFHQIFNMWSYAAGILPLNTTTISPLHINLDFLDVYEPDDALINASRIEINSVQHRGFHGIPVGTKMNFSLINLDFDWIKLEVPYNGMKLNLRTLVVPGRPTVNTELFVYESNGTTLIASNDDKSTTDFYSEI